MPVAALVLGIVGLVLSLVPCLGMYAMPLTVLAIVMGVLGRKKPTGKGMALAGMICGIIGTLIAGWWIYAYLTVKDAAKDAEDQLKQELKKEADKLGTPVPTPNP